MAGAVGMAEGSRTDATGGSTAFRQAGWLLLVGGVLAAASTALHPVTLNPRDPAAVLDAVRANSTRWIAVHVTLGVGVAAWSLGWFAVYQGLRDAGRARWSGAGAMLAVAALAVWIPLLALEAAGLPLIARATPPGHSPLGWNAAWPATLAGGYVATGLYWLAGIAAAWDLAAPPAGTPGGVATSPAAAPAGSSHPEADGPAGARPVPPAAAGGTGRREPRRQGAGGPAVPLGISLAALLPGLPGMAIAWFIPAVAVPVLLATLLPGALWALLLAWRMVTRRGEPPGAVRGRPR